jgi:hypothetical protein
MYKNIDGHVLIRIDARMSVMGMYSVYMWVRYTGQNMQLEMKKKNNTMNKADECDGVR